MKNVKCFELVSGQSIVGNVSKDGLTIETPMRIHTQLAPNGEMGFAFLPYIPYKKLDQSNIKMFAPEHLLMEPFDLIDDLENGYKEIVQAINLQKSGIVLPSNDSILDFSKFKK